MAASRPAQLRSLRRAGQALVDRFAANYPAAAAAAASTSTGTAQVATDNDVADNPFRPSRNAKTGRWAPPRISLRRQAQLVSLAHQSGRLDLLPEGPKTSKLQARLAGLATAPYEPSPMSSASATQAEKKLSQAEEEKLALEVARTVGRHGPYVGRQARRMFKGSKDERGAARRQRNIQERLKLMEGSIKEWRAVSDTFYPFTLGFPRRRRSCSRGSSVLLAGVGGSLGWRVVASCLVLSRSAPWPVFVL